MAEEALLGALAENPSSRIPSVETLAKELVFALGDPIAGAASLRDLLSQTSATGDDPEDWEGERLPLAVSHPWVPGAFARLLAAATTLPLSWQLAPLLAHDPDVARGAAVACAALTALWPPLGSVLVGGALCVAVALHASTAAPLLLAIVMAITGLIWWATCGIRSKLATPALLLCGCASSPLAASAIAGCALTPAAACATACVGWLLGRLWPSLVAAGFALDGMVDALLYPLATLPALVSLAGCCVAAALCSALTWWRPQTSYAIWGQVLGCIVLVAAQLLAARMENGGIWADPSWGNAGIAVLLSVLVCTACILHGPRDAGMESEDSQ